MSTAATKTKTEIDPDVEGGAVALAEELLPPSEERLTKALALATAWTAYTETRSRIDAAIKRAGEIAAELRKGPDESMRKKLTAERTALTGELVHAAADFEAVASPYATALGHWARSAYQGAQVEIRKIASEMNPLREARMRLNSRLDVSLSPQARPTDAEREKAQREVADLSTRIKALEEEGWRFKEVARAAEGSVSKFGEAYEGLFESAGQRRWIKGVRAAISRKTTGLTGMSDVLKPGF